MEEKEKPKATINDVAQQAGVSKGTVDRVLHNRGEVSPKSREKVERAIEELGFKPNIYASILASKKVRRIVCLIPEFNPGEFWELTDEGIRAGEEDAANYGVSIVKISYDQYDAQSFQEACAKTIAEDPVGVVIAPIDGIETLKFVRELASKGISYAYIDSKIEDDDGYLAYFGMPMYRSGYLCADILASVSNLDSINVIRIDRDLRGLSDPTLMRRSGFLDYVHERHPDSIVNHVFLNPKDKDARYETLDRMFERTPSRNLVMFNSRVHLVSDYLRERNIRDCVVIGYDVLEKNLAALREGYVQILIAQHTDRQIRSAINAIVEEAILLRPLPRRDNFMSMDILTRFNCDYYLM